MGFEISVEKGERPIVEGTIVVSGKGYDRAGEIADAVLELLRKSGIDKEYSGSYVFQYQLIKVE